MTNEPSWDEIFAKRPTPPAGATASPAAGSPAEPGAASPVAPVAPSPVAPGQPGQPLTRREARARAEQEEQAARDAAAAQRPSTFASVTGGGAPPPKRRRRTGWIGLLIVLLVFGGGAYAAWSLFEPQIRALLGWQLPEDYEGSGTAKTVDVVIASGDTGVAISHTLAKAGVTMTPKAFYDLLVATEPAPTFQPGTYRLHARMSAAAALAALQDPASRVVTKVLITEGQTLPQLLQTLADKTGTPLADLQAASQDLAALGIPAGEPSAEGWLFPATYEFDPGTSAADMLGQMAQVMRRTLDKAGVAEADRHDVLTLASIIQKEGGSTADFYKVARVFQNRLDIGMRLQSDATVAYGAGSSRIATTAAQRADTANPYNTYARDGLPVGPISAPGADAIDAALHPAAGDWLYFVLVDGETGETVFSKTAAEHETAVKQWQAWIRDHPDFDNG
ncbi:endolytic transglycosylase MltG [Galbitalea sp. SE-J8]|uniref:endolytic transglycosylase MltG n=1 Tax=Galbitalea sp. SE-J8 TaxID=3054952 RepID=UPI00259C9243|nr:endolytic transglycosylase MltG [Galbitalea sp. SE-J8]MDM4763251.1 endolytic transglycosylase MltG [Galbitalea sp. SE-J8]